MLQSGRWWRGLMLRTLVGLSLLSAGVEVVRASSLFLIVTRSSTSGTWTWTSRQLSSLSASLSSHGLSAVLSRVRLVMLTRTLVTRTSFVRVPSVMASQLNWHVSRQKYILKTLNIYLWQCAIEIDTELLPTKLCSGSRLMHDLPPLATSVTWRHLVMTSLLLCYSVLQWTGFIVILSFRFMQHLCRLRTLRQTSGCSGQPCTVQGGDKRWCMSVVVGCGAFVLCCCWWWSEWVSKWVLLTSLQGDKHLSVKWLHCNWSRSTWPHSSDGL